MKRILVIDDDQNMCTLLQRLLVKKGFEAEVAYSSASGTEAFRKQDVDAVLCDYRLDNKTGGDLLHAFKLLKPEIPFIIITGFSDLKTAVALIKDGAFDYITKPLMPENIVSVINKALEQKPAVKQEAKPLAEQHSAKQSNASSKGLSFKEQEIVVGESLEIKELFRQVDLIASTNYSVIIYGESGTGKEVMARAIHARSERSNAPFVALDCGTLTKELAGSEMFGHVKGSFTGAVTDKAGHFELANGGTLFLDEVGNLSIEIQASLLRVIQERKFKRIGGTQDIEVDIRILVASNDNLRTACTQGRFREDLFHRLNEFAIDVPPLRQRVKDVPLFADFFLAQANKELNKQITGFDADAMEKLVDYPWPGNLREMMNVIRRMALLAKGKTLTLNSLPPEIREKVIIPYSVGSDNSPLYDAGKKAEYETILSVLKEVKYNKTKAAELLKIDRKTLYNKLKSLSLPV